MINGDLSLSHKVKRKVNKNIYTIIDFFITLCEDSGDFEIHVPYIFPAPHLIKEDFEKCKHVIYDLRDFAIDEYPHELEPLYQYALYYLFQWCLDATDPEKCLLKATIEISEIISDDDRYIADHINDIEAYQSFMFYDSDFLNVPELLELNKNSPILIERFLHITLDYYTDLMPPDIRASFLDKRNDDLKIIDEEELIIKLIYSVIKRKEEKPKRLQEISETDLSDDIADFLYGILTENHLQVHREMPAGFAKKKAGELDFAITSFKNKVHEMVAIGEL